MRIPEETKNIILQTANLHDIIAEHVVLKKQGANLEGTCPMCQKTGKGKGLQYNHTKGLYKCFSCGFGGNSAVNFLMSVKKIKYPEALAELAAKYSIEIMQPKKMLSAKGEISYCEKKLKESGLSSSDVEASVYVDDVTRKEIPTFQSGTRNQYGQIEPGNDIIIWYYDIDGKPTMYKKEKTNRFEHLFRIRWQFPEQHQDKNNNPIKYQSPAGSGTHLYIPEKIRNAYQKGSKITRLFLQEGELKAEKACKHGMLSVGLMGINSLGQQNRLPFDINLIVQRCMVEEVVFVVDADLFELSRKLTIKAPLDQRSWSFFSAIKNFKKYFEELRNQDLYIDTYFAYNYSDKNYKGIDDQLVGMFKNKEHELVEDIDRAINTKEGKGVYYQVYKITTEPEAKLLKLWNLDSAEKFAEYHKETIIKSGLKEFTISRHRWRFDENEKLELAQPITEDEKYWVDKSYTDKNNIYHEKIQFVYGRCYTFLQNRGFGRIKMKDGKWYFAKIDNKIIRIVEAWEMKDYIMTLSKEICPENVMELFYRGGKMYFGTESLSNLNFIMPHIKESDKKTQQLYFKNKFWNISTTGIEEKNYEELDGFVWEDKIIDYQPKLLKNKMFSVEKLDDEFFDINQELKSILLEFKGNYVFEMSEEAQRCHYAMFLLNASNFHHYKKELTYAEKMENSMAFIAKMTCLGYLMHEFRNKSCEVAVICMDGKLSEVGESHGRTGKSLFGFAIDQMLPTVYINGKKKDLTEDTFWAEEVTEKSSVIFIDDLRANIDFEFFFPVITGKLTINGKGIKKFTLSEKDTPKLLMTTNHAINGSTGSFRARQAIIAFSDYYNEDRRPAEDFGLNFWSEWDGTEQWNLFYNFMSECLQLYLEIGLVAPIFENIEKRRMRQFLGEDFLSWANDKYGTTDDQDPNEVYDSEFMNRKLTRYDLQADFWTKYRKQEKYVTATIFKKKLKVWCQYRNLRFNPHKIDSKSQPGADDKSGGTEYITVANDKFESDSF